METMDLRAASEYYFGKPVAKLTVPEAGLLAGMIRGPKFSPILHAQRALARRNIVLDRMARADKIHPNASAASDRSAALVARGGAAQHSGPYFVEEIPQISGKHLRQLKRCTNADSVYTRLSMSTRSARPTRPSAMGCTLTTGVTAGAASSTTFSAIIAINA